MWSFQCQFQISLTLSARQVSQLQLVPRPNYLGNVLPNPDLISLHKKLLLITTTANGMSTPWIVWSFQYQFQRSVSQSARLVSQLWLVPRPNYLGNVLPNPDLISWHKKLLLST